MVAVVAVLLAATGWPVGGRLQRWATAAPYRRPGDRVRRRHRPTWVRAASVVLPVSAWTALALQGRPALGLVVAPLAWLLVPLAVVDLDVHRLPDALQLPAYPVVLLALGAVGAAEGQAGAVLRSAAAAAVVLLVGGALWLCAPRQGLGLGDVKLAGLLAALLAQLGWSQVVLGLWLGLATGGVVAAVALVTRRLGRRDHLALGPPLMLGALVVLALG